MSVTVEIITFQSRDNIRLRDFGVGDNWLAVMGPDPAKSGGPERGPALV